MTVMTAHIYIYILLNETGKTTTRSWPTFLYDNDIRTKALRLRQHQASMHIAHTRTSQAGFPSRSIPAYTLRKTLSWLKPKTRSKQ